jgi:hypothetical protein
LTSSASSGRSICSPTNGIRDTRGVADPRVNVTRWWLLCDRVLYARIGTSVAVPQVDIG